MRAVVVEAPGPADVLHVMDAAEPSPNAGELSIDVEFAGVGFVDTLFRAGEFELPMPLIPGIEVTGRVRELGASVDGFRVGQPVAALLNDFGRGPRVGGYAEIAVAHASMATVVPENADLARIAAAIVNGTTAWLGLHDYARLRVADTVLVLGASGGLGSSACRLAAIHPAQRVIGVVGSAAKLAAAPSECTDVILSSDLEPSIDRLTDGEGVDVVIDPVGGDPRAKAYQLLAPLGRLLVLGNASGEDHALSSDAAWLGSRQVIGLSLGGVAHLVPDRVSVALKTIVELVDRGVLRQPDPAVVPLAKAADVHEALQNRTAPAKSVLAIHAS
jgi:NADPH:quinone reductase